jgi:hypothetical protein
MAKKVFTKVFHGQVVASGTDRVVENAVHTWLAQEDIEVVGVQSSIVSTTPSENDGFSSAEVELSQVGVIDTDGALSKVVASDGWNTTPAGICATAGHTEVAFAPALAIPVKEEGYLYINTSSLGKTAGLSVYSYSVIVFYTKKGTR